jgi:aminotransferase
MAYGYSRTEVTPKAGMAAKIVPRAQNSHVSGLREALKSATTGNYINLGAGACNIAPDPRVLEAAREAFCYSQNSYAPLQGIEKLRDAIAQHSAACHNLTLRPNEIAITCGATGAFEAVCKSFIDPGDEVVMFEPFYQYHVRQVMERGGIPRYVPLQAPGWEFSQEQLSKIISENTKFLVLTNPNNPTGKIFSRMELAAIADVCKAAGVFIVSEEVYEHTICPEAHISIASLPGMFEHTLTLSSASKTFFVTGWRIGWVTGPAEIVSLLAVKSDETYLCAPTPLQHAVAECLGFEEEFFRSIALRFDQARTQLCSSLKAAGFMPCSPQGAFYALAEYHLLGYHDDLEAVNAILDEFGIVTVPGNVFFEPREHTGMVRFCFAIESDVLNNACERLMNVRGRVERQLFR